MERFQKFPDETVPEFPDETVSEFPDETVSEFPDETVSEFPRKNEDFCVFLSTTTGGQGKLLVLEYVALRRCIRAAAAGI